MLTLRGASALSDFRLQKLLKRLADAVAAEITLSAEYVHFIDVGDELSVEQLEVLERLLE
jgi:phosphoribosylformylglycinamidine synthase